MRSLSSGESLHCTLPEAKLHLLLDARAKCSSERVEPREIGTILGFKWTEYLSFMCNLCRALQLLLQLRVLYQLYQEGRRKGNLWLRATCRICQRMQIYALDTLHFTGTLSKHQAFLSTRVGGGKKVTSDSLCSQFIKSLIRNT